MGLLMRFLLRNFQSSHIILQLKSRFMIYVAFCSILIYIGGAIYSSYMQIIDPGSGESLVMPILLSIFIGIFFMATGIFFIQRGNYTAGANIILVSGLAIVWVVMILDKSHAVSRLNTISFILVLLTVTPLAAVKPRWSIFMVYIAVNIIALAAYMIYFQPELNLAAPVFLDHFAGNVLSLIAIAVVAYNIHSINNRAMEYAAREIETREKTESVLRESEERFRMLVENINDVIYSIDTKGVINYISPAIEFQSKYTVNDILGKRIIDFVYPDDVPILYEDYQKVLKGDIVISEIRVVDKDNAVKFMRIANRSVVTNGVISGVTAVMSDITEWKKTENELRKLSRAVEQSRACIMITDIKGNIEYINPAFEAITGYSFSEVIGKNPRFLKSGKMNEDKYRRMWSTINDGNVWHGEFNNRKKSGELYWESASISPVKNTRGEITHFVAVKEDITDRKIAEEAIKLNELRLNSLLELSQKSYNLQEKDIIQEALEEAVRLTVSEIGYCHFVNDDQETIELVTWSRDTLRDCTAAQEKHYPLSEAGVWADSAREHRPVVHNDYPALDEKKGLPEGHSELIRHLSVPVIEGDNSRVIMGVGNKRTDYDESDIRQLQLIANDTWRMVKRKRAENDLRKLTAIIETSSDFIGISDLEGHFMYINESGKRIAGIDGSLKQDSYNIYNFIIPEDIKRVRHGLNRESLDKEDWQGECRIRHAGLGKIVPVEINAFIIKQPEYPDAMAAIIRDITERKKSERALIELAESDPLTGIYNRRRFFEIASKTFKDALLNSSHLSVLMIDVDYFKNVNDTYGHSVGDQVLIGVVARMTLCLRDTDILGRYGGEEFVVLMPGADQLVALMVAQRLLVEVRGRPIETGRIELPVTISIGVAVIEESSDIAIDDMIKRSDEALYLAKESGRDQIKLGAVDS